MKPLNELEPSMTHPGGARDWLILFMRNGAGSGQKNCVEWPFGKTRAGYGVLKFEGLHTTVHRIVYAYLNG